MKDTIYVKATRILRLIEDAERKIQDMYEDDIHHAGYFAEYTVEEFVNILELTDLQLEYLENNIQAIFESNLWHWYNLIPTVFNDHIMIIEQGS